MLRIQMLSADRVTGRIVYAILGSGPMPLAMCESLVDAKVELRRLSRRTFAR